MTDAEKALLELVLETSLDDADGRRVVTDAAMKVRIERAPLEILESAARKYELYIEARSEWLPTADWLGRLGIFARGPDARERIVEAIEAKRAAP